MPAPTPPDDRLAATLGYYETHAVEFDQRTRDRDMDDLYRRFLKLVPPGGRLLDAGCGPGRDVAHFLRLGYQVAAFDPAAAMVRLATARTGIQVRQSDFGGLDAVAAFDGIWASASLLHVPRSEMRDVFDRIGRALVPEGILFASYKVGPGEEFREERLFNDYDEAAFRTFLATTAGWRELSLWRCADTRPGRTGVVWLNALLRKVQEDGSRRGARLEEHGRARTSTGTQT
jgi:SAM-dependent methyltransferase